MTPFKTNDNSVYSMDASAHILKNRTCPELSAQFLETHFFIQILEIFYLILAKLCNTLETLPNWTLSSRMSFVKHLPFIGTNGSIFCNNNCFIVVVLCVANPKQLKRNITHNTILCIIMRYTIRYSVCF